MRILSRNRKGYFLMVEWDTHTDNLKRGLDRMVALDRAIEQHRAGGRPDTLLLFTADHSFDLRMRGGQPGTAAARGSRGRRGRVGRREAQRHPHSRVADGQRARRRRSARRGAGARRAAGARLHGEHRSLRRDDGRFRLAGGKAGTNDDTASVSGRWIQNRSCAQFSCCLCLSSRFRGRRRSAGWRTAATSKAHGISPPRRSPATTSAGSRWPGPTGPAKPSQRFATKKPAAFEATPLVVDGTMFVGTPLGRVIALDAATGRERWVFDPKIARDVDLRRLRQPRRRRPGSTTRRAADAPCRRRIFVATAQSQLFALDARDGRPCAGFGADGMVDLKAGLRIPPFEPQAYSMTSPPVVVNGVVITGSSVADNTRPDIAERRGARATTRAPARSEWSVGSDPAGSQRSGVPRMARRDGAQERRRQRVVGAGGAIRSATSCSSRPAAPRPTTTARCGSATTATPTRSSRCEPRPAASSGRSRPCTTISGTTTTPRRRRWSRSRRTARAFPPSCRRTKTGMLFVLNRETGAPDLSGRGTAGAGERHSRRRGLARRSRSRR